MRLKAKGLMYSVKNLQYGCPRHFLAMQLGMRKTLSLMFISSEHGRLIKKMQKRWLQSLPNSKEMK